MALSTDREQFESLGWCRYSGGAALLNWVEQIKPVAQQVLHKPENQIWWRHGATWFAGVNVLPNDKRGRVAGGDALDDQLCNWVRTVIGLDEQTTIDWEPGQLSVLKPGYPQRDPDESLNAHRFRCNRDAAHVDGLLPVGEARRRMPQEFHRFILGIPLLPAPAHAGPTVVWEGSHKIMQQAFIDALQNVSIQDWLNADLTDVYQRTRREVFERCKRVEVHVPPGDCYLIHRFALHGVAPWQPLTGEQDERRSIVFFRPEVAERSTWLTAR